MCKIAVAPLVGAWIEILLIPGFMTAACVAPLVGAWIEIDVYDFTDFRVNVAPLVGAWIEMPWWERGSSCKASLPLWERGLKYHVHVNEYGQDPVAPLVGAWIEICITLSEKPK